MCVFANGPNHVTHVDTSQKNSFWTKLSFCFCHTCARWSRFSDKDPTNTLTLEGRVHSKDSRLAVAWKMSLLFKIFWGRTVSLCLLRWLRRADSHHTDHIVRTLEDVFVLQPYWIMCTTHRCQDYNKWLLGKIGTNRLKESFQIKHLLH